MVTLEFGPFVFLIAMGALFFGLGWYVNSSKSVLFGIISFLSFTGLALLTIGGPDISMIETEYIYDEISNELAFNSTNVDVVIPSVHASWMGWLFFGFGILSFIVTLHRGGGGGTNP